MVNGVFQMFALCAWLERCKSFKSGRVSFLFNVHILFERENFFEGIVR